MKLAIALTLYRRWQYTAQVFKALLECYGVEGIPVYISHDWSFRHFNDSESVKKLANDFIRRHTGPTKYFQHRPNLGIDLNKLFVIPEAFKDGADFVIFIEDDTVPSKDALRYFMAMAERFKDDKEVWSICGYNNLKESEFQIAKERPHAIGRAVGFNPWIWGTWRDRWEEFYGDGGEEYKADTGIEANGLFDHWLTNKCRNLIAPIVPRCRLIGEHDAEHTTPSDWERERNPFGAWDLDLPDLGNEWPEEYLPLGLLHAGTAQIENPTLA